MSAKAHDRDLYSGISTESVLTSYQFDAVGSAVVTPRRDYGETSGANGFVDFLDCVNITYSTLFP